MVSVIRKSTESEIEIKLSPPPVADDYRQKINTPIPFLNHMIEHFIWRSGFNISVDLKLDKFDLSHVVCEDIGITLGKAFLEYLNRQKGTYGYGDAFGMIDEAKAHTCISFESRAYFHLDSNVTIPTDAETMLSEDLKVFIDGFSQGAQCTIQIDVLKGENSHHIWEAVFRSFGTAVKNALSQDKDRPNLTAGVAGKINYIVK